MLVIPPRPEFEYQCYSTLWPFTANVLCPCLQSSAANAKDNYNDVEIDWKVVTVVSTIDVAIPFADETFPGQGQLQQDKDVVAHQDTMLAFRRAKPSAMGSTIDIRTLADRRYYHGIRTMVATGLGVAWAWTHCCQLQHIRSDLQSGYSLETNMYRIQESPCQVSVDVPETRFI
ncbi:hypothetical protein CONLIGDRAFT_692494 [Coniochaeta ligniaria NRRL 30616]|uniref:Uncharacterized protein n=1 Tax=Coniochaeta ligniaria NRRL 30616 TaxID=1408157 RepID=A0A1J7J395_9PEZI|nr:hypothetical protein CONLIGDRAFT_692494 [Coniochaeta ligniaria NRRL 30616]